MPETIGFLRSLFAVFLNQSKVDESDLGSIATLPYDFFLEFQEGVDPGASFSKSTESTSAASVRGSVDSKSSRSELAALVLDELRRNRLRIRRVNGTKSGRMAFAIGAEFSVLMKQAEKLKFRKKLKTGGSVPFSSKRLTEFENADFPARLFTSGERLVLLESLVLKPKIIRQALGELSSREDITQRLVKEATTIESHSSSFQSYSSSSSSPTMPSSSTLGNSERENNPNGTTRVIAQLIPLHNPEEADALAKAWIRSLRPQPLDNIKAYFGHERGFYFAFLGSYTSWLILPALLGIKVFIDQHGSDTKLQHPSTLFYGMFLALWSTMFLEYWKRRQNALAFEWDSLDFEASEEEEREEFKKRAVLVYNAVAEAYQWKYPGYKRILAFIVSFVVCLAFCALATAVMLYFLFLGTWAETEWTGQGWEGPWMYAKHTPIALYFASISVFSTINRSLAGFLTNLENHRTTSEYQNALIVKLVLLQFFNYFVSLFYIGFINRDVEKLSSNVASLLGVYQVIGQLIEVGVPLSSALYGAAKTVQDGLSGSLRRPGDLLNIGQTDSLLVDGEDLFPDYLELWIQFGQVTLFSMVFPLGALLALVNNVFEIRLDAVKMLRTQKRGIPRRVSGIGSWLEIFEVMGYIAVMTNVALAGLIFDNSSLGKKWLQDWSSTQKLLLLVAVEHGIVALKFAISVVVPDVSSDVSFVIRTRQEALEHEMSLEFEARADCSDLLARDRKVFNFQNGLEQGRHLARAALTSTSEEDIRFQESLLVHWILDREDRKRHAERQMRYMRNQLEKLSKKSDSSFASTIQVLNVVVAGLAFLFLFTSEARQSFSTKN